jgi:hypothetical protein
MKKTIAAFGSLVIDIEGRRLTGKMVGADGEVKDTFAIVKGEEPP